MRCAKHFPMKTSRSGLKGSPPRANAEQSAAPALGSRWARSASPLAFRPGQGPYRFAARKRPIVAAEKIRSRAADPSIYGELAKRMGGWHGPHQLSLKPS